jgi:predicted DNA-binding protein (MmcQ/YjbR family)
VADLLQTCEQFSALCLTLPEARVQPSGKAEVREFTIGGREGKSFALFVTSGEQRGVHLRSVDPAVTDDRRFERSRAAGFLPSNWIHLRWTSAGPDWEELEKLLVESHRLTTRRGEGVPTDDETDRFHPVLGKALSSTYPHLRPKGALHAGGPPAELTPVAEVEIALWAAARVEDLVPEAHQKQYARVLELARLALSLTQKKFNLPRPHLLELREAAGTAVWNYQVSQAILAARGLAEATAALGDGAPVGEGAAAATDRAARAMLEVGRNEDLTAFLEELDERILAREFEAAALQKTGEVPPPVQVLWRGSDEQGFTSIWLVRLLDGGYGLLHGVGRRWLLSQGARDELLAAIPDQMREAATQVAQLRDVG